MAIDPALHPGDLLHCPHCRQWHALTGDLTAEHEPDYFEVATFSTHEQAEAYLTTVTEEELAMAQARARAFPASTV